MSKFKDKQLYTDIFPLFRSNLVGTEYVSQQNEARIPQTEKPKLEITTKKFNNPREFKPRIPVKKEVATETTNQNMKNPIMYDTSLHFPTPKEDLDLPLYIALKMTYPEQILKYKQNAERYNYFIDTQLTDNEHLVLVNPQKNITIFGVRGTNVENFNDILTNIKTPFVGLKQLDRYKQAEKKGEEIKQKYKNNEIIRVGHSLGGLIQSVLSNDNEKVYTYNRPYSYPVKDNEIAISVETDPLFNVNKNDRKKIKTIPRTYYELAKDYVGIEKAKINPLYEEKPIKIPEKYKTDMEVVAYKNIKSYSPIPINIGINHFTKKPEIQPTTAMINRVNRISQRVPQFNTLQSFNNLRNIESQVSNSFDIMKNPFVIPIVSKAIGTTANYLSRRASNSHALENLPLNIRIEKTK